LRRVDPQKNINPIGENQNEKRIFEKNDEQRGMATMLFKA